MKRVVQLVDRIARSIVAVLALALLALGVVVLAAAGVAPVVIGVLVGLLAAGLAWVGNARPGPALAAITITGLSGALVGLVHDDRATPWAVAIVTVALLACLVDDPLGTRLAPAVRAVQLPGVRPDTRRRPAGPFTVVVLVTLTVLAVLLVLGALVPLPAGVEVTVLALLLGGLLWSSVGLRRAILARRNGTVDQAVSAALRAYEPEFLVYFSGPPTGDYQVRMWLPYLDRLGIRYAILTREDGMLARAAGLSPVPLLTSPRLAGLDACLVPSVRAIFYVNTHPLCVDGVRYLDRTHVHLNHGDSDKPASYHPMISMFDRIFVAGQAAVDRFAGHGVLVPQEKFVHVGRPQVGSIVVENLEPLPDRATVLYAPTWRGGVRDMRFSSLDHGEQIVRALLALGVRVLFRPHPYSLRDRRAAAQIARIDAVLAEAATEQCPHLSSARTGTGPIADWFNRSDALVTDVSSVVSDYLQSGKPMAVADLGGAGSGETADPNTYPVLRATYLLDLAGDLATGLHPMLTDDPLVETRAEVRTHYLGDHADPVETFVSAARQAIADTP